MYNDNKAIQPGEPETWPPIAGAYLVGDPRAPVAVCSLTSGNLPGYLSSLPGVAIAGELQTANAGIENIILNVIANPFIRFLLLCGKDSRLFRQGQSLCALVEDGVDAERRIIGAEGYEPVLRNVTRQQIEVFRQQVELADWTGEKEVDVLRARISSLAIRASGPFRANDEGITNIQVRPTFAVIRPGGLRQPLRYDEKGYFVITINRATHRIIVHHFLSDHTPAHEMEGSSAESMLLGLIREGLISQLSHAGYLGAELAKAESALRLGRNVRYEQDRPLRQENVIQDVLPTEESIPQTSDIGSSLTMELFNTTAPGKNVAIVCEIITSSQGSTLSVFFLEPLDHDPLCAFKRTQQILQVHWNEQTQVVMGNPEHFSQGALLRVHGILSTKDKVNAEMIAILTHVAKIEE